MNVLPLDANDPQILATARLFVGCLAQERYEDALALIDPWEGYGNWTPELIRKVITNYGSPEPRADGRTFRVSLDTAPSKHGVHQEVERLSTPAPSDPVVIGSVFVDVPLNGEWSDLTIIFDLVRRNNGIVLRLNDIHVL